MNIGDEVTINGRVVAINKYTVVVELDSHLRILVKPSDINTIHPYQPIPETDERKGN